jgi:hypothetical protein
VTNIIVVVIVVFVPSMSRMIIRWRAATITRDLTETALHGCPPKHRPDVLRASAELAEGLGAENSFFPVRATERHSMPKSTVPGLARRHF